jgi:hypothetical protein
MSSSQFPECQCSEHRECHSDGRRPQDESCGLAVEIDIVCDVRIGIDGIEIRYVGITVSIEEADGELFEDYERNGDREGNEEGWEKHEHAGDPWWRRRGVPYLFLGRSSTGHGGGAGSREIHCYEWSVERHFVAEEIKCRKPGLFDIERRRENTSIVTIEIRVLFDLEFVFMGCL